MSNVCIYIIDDCWNIIKSFLLGNSNEWDDRNHVGYLKKYKQIINNEIGFTSYYNLLNKKINYIQCSRACIKNIDIFYNCIKNANFILSIELWHMEIDNYQFNIICKLLYKLKNLKSLHLSNNHVSNIDNIAPLLKNNIKLTSLGLSSNKLTNVNNLFKSLYHNKNLKNLYLNYNNINNIKYFIKLLTYNNKLSHINLSHNNIHNVYNLNKILKNKYNIRYLCLSRNFLNDDISNMLELTGKDNDNLIIVSQQRYNDLVIKPFY